MIKVDIQEKTLTAIELNEVDIMKLVEEGLRIQPFENFKRFIGDPERAFLMQKNSEGLIYIIYKAFVGYLSFTDEDAFVHEVPVERIKLFSLMELLDICESKPGAIMKLSQLIK